MSDDDDLPEPMTPPGTDMRHYRWMKLDIVALQNSDFNTMLNDSAFRAGINLWQRAFHQVPAGSIPDDDIVLCALAGLGQNIKKWKSIKGDALRGFIRCRDGRLYHPMVSQFVNEALGKKSNDRDRKRQQRERERQESEYSKSLLKLVAGTDLNTTPETVSRGRHCDTVSPAEERHGDIVTDSDQGHADVTVTPCRGWNDVTRTSRGRHAGEGDKKEKEVVVGTVRSPIPRGRNYRQPNADAEFVRQHVTTDKDGQRRCRGVLMSVIEKQVFDLAQIDPTKTPVSTAVIARWLAEGIRPDDICDAVRWKTKQLGYEIPDNLNVFNHCVRIEHERRQEGKKS